MSFMDKVKQLGSSTKGRLVLVGGAAAILGVAVSARRKAAAAAAGAPQPGDVAQDPRSSMIMGGGETFTPDGSYGGGSIGGAYNGGPDLTAMFQWMGDMATKIDGIAAGAGATSTTTTGTTPTATPSAAPDPVATPVAVPPVPTAIAPTAAPPSPQTSPGGYSTTGVAKPGTTVEGRVIAGWVNNPYMPGHMAPLVKLPNGTTYIHPNWQPGGPHGPKVAPPVPAKAPVKPKK